MYTANSNDPGGCDGSLQAKGVRESILVLIKFKVLGNLRFLSHAETSRVFERACARAGIKIQHSQGFNPRPKLSLPLPRSVGVESDDDLLCLQLDSLSGLFDVEGFKTGLSEQLPEGCELITVNVAAKKTSFQPCLATYVLVVQQQYLNEALKAEIEHLLANESLNIERLIDADKSPKAKKVDVRPFLNSIKSDDKSIIVECNISPAGSIRVDEILKLLKLDYEMLSAPIRRTSVKWQQA